MAKSASSQTSTPAENALRRQMIERLARHTIAEGRNETAVPGLKVNRISAPTACHSVTYEPRLILFAQGEKHIQIHRSMIVCDATTYMLTAVDLPVLSQVTVASMKRPMLGLTLDLDLGEVRRILGHGEFVFPSRRSALRGFATGTATAALLEPCLRLLDLLDHPEDIPFLGKTIQREILYRLLRSEHGEFLQSVASTSGNSHRAAKAIAWLRANYAQPLRVEELARIAEMGVSTLHHHFRALTSLSPVQYQKRLRLHVARERMLQHDDDVASAAYAVGYESLSQFTREYSRFFGQPPRRDVLALRERLMAAD